MQHVVVVVDVDDDVVVVTDSQSMYMSDRVNRHPCLNEVHAYLSTTNVRAFILFFRSVKIVKCT